jgi:hypothetical protein
MGLTITMRSLLESKLSDMLLTRPTSILILRTAPANAFIATTTSAENDATSTTSCRTGRFQTTTAPANRRRRQEDRRRRSVHKGSASIFAEMFLKDKSGDQVWRSISGKTSLEINFGRCKFGDAALSERHVGRSSLCLGQTHQTC